VRRRAAQFVNEDYRWAKLRPKLAKWLCLCEMFPYRMSFLVLIITDRVQKALVNRLAKEHPSRGKYRLVGYGKALVNQLAKEHPSRGKYRPVGYGKVTTADEGSELPEDMPIVEAYFQYVERYIYSHPKARKMLSLDGDPVRERCTFLRHCPPHLAVDAAFRHVACAGAVHRAAHLRGG